VAVGRHRGLARLLSVTVAVLLLAGLATVVRRVGDAPQAQPASGSRSATPVTSPAPTDVAALAAARFEAASAPVPAAGPVPVPLPGCPPPPRPPGAAGPTSATWRPAVLVPEAALPEPVPAPAEAGPSASLDSLRGKGMWVWRFRQSEGGDAEAIVARAKAAGLRQLWVRVGDSRDGFYAADVLSELVPRAHGAGLSVIGWGFPYLWDPVADARWTAEALAWRGPHGAGLDGFSPDIEMASEGVQLTERRARVYLGLVRQANPERLLVATVYPPRDRVWAVYPYAAIASYVDAFAPMVYWGCTEPGEAATQALERLASLRPVHLIGQGYDMADEGGRSGAPGAAETHRFLDVARRGGALGASFWVWQSIGPEQWNAMAAFPWLTRV
jgi:hypothetical protein